MLRSTTKAFRSSLTATLLSCSSKQRCYHASRKRAPPSAFSSSSASSQKRKPTRTEAPVILAENRCALVTTWDMLKNPAEAFALIRAVEQRYGPVESFVFGKDFDSPSTYMTKVHVTFQDVESFNRVPILPATLHIRGPKVQPKRPGGVGLDEIQPYIEKDVEFLTANEISEMGRFERTIDFRIQQADKAHLLRSPFQQTPMGQQQRKAIGSKMLQWGGFHEMEPIEAKQPITNKDLTNETIDHVYMRRALREWAKVCGEPNPFEIQLEKATEPESIQEEVEEGEEKENEEDSEALEGWTLEVERPSVVQDPIEQILGMEEAEVVGKRSDQSMTASELRSELSEFTGSNQNAAGPSMKSSSDSTQNTPHKSDENSSPSLSSFSRGLPDITLHDFDPSQPQQLSHSSTPFGSNSSHTDSGLAVDHINALTEPHTHNSVPTNEVPEELSQGPLETMETVEEGRNSPDVVEAEKSSKPDPRSNGVYDKLQDILKGS